MGHPTLFRHSVDYVDLVLHKCDERRHNYGRALHDERGQLVAEALASARGHKYKGVIASKEVAYDGLLVTLEVVEAEKMFQPFCQAIVFSHRSGSVVLLCCFQLMQMCLVKLFLGIVQSYLKLLQPA